MNFIEKKFIPRRTFIRGAGVILGLPLLDSMIPAQTPLNKTAAVPVRRFMGIWHPHGAAPGYWSPLQEGANFEFSFITKPLEPFRNRPHAHHRHGYAGGHGHHRRAWRRSCARRGSALRHAPAPECRQSVSRRHPRSVDREEIWPGHHSRIHSAWRSKKMAITVIATGATAAPIPTASPGLRPCSLCRPKSIRAWRSSACSATAPARRNGRSDGSRTPASWIR